MKNISRIDQDHKKTHGWFVRIKRDGRQVSKFFSDSKYDGKENALEAARAYRDKNLSEWEHFARNHDRAMHVRTNSNIGYNGISYTVKKKSKNGRTYEEHVFSVCYSPEKGVNKNKTFYIKKADTKAQFKKYYQEKLEEAIAFRDTKMREIFGLRYVNYKMKKAKEEKEKEQE